MISDMYLARRAFGDRVTIYPVNVRTLPRTWTFTPRANPELVEPPFCLRQAGRAALDNSPAAALAALERTA